MVIILKPLCCRVVWPQSVVINNHGKVHLQYDREASFSSQVFLTTPNDISPCTQGSHISHNINKYYDMGVPAVNKNNKMAIDSFILLGQKITGLFYFNRTIMHFSSLSAVFYLSLEGEKWLCE